MVYTAYTAKVSTIDRDKARSETPMPHSPRRPRATGSRVRLADRFVLTDVVSHLLRRAHFRAEELFSAELGQSGLTPRQKALLVTTYQHPGETQNQLAERIALDRHSFAEMLRRMVARGLLRRAPAHTDGRAYAIFVTPKGEALLGEVLPHDRVVEERVLEPLPPEYRPLFIKCLQIMVGIEPAAAGGASPAAAPSAPVPARTRRRRPRAPG